MRLLTAARPAEAAPRPAPMLPFLLGFGALYAVLAGLAELDSTGRYGVAILAAVLVATVAVAGLLDRTGPVPTLRRLGLGRPGGRAVAVALGTVLLVLGVYPVAGLVSGADLAPRPGWPWLLLGIFAFHGLAEELVWRGYAFGRLRRDRSFGAAVVATMPLLAATHVPVVLTSGVAVGAAAMLVAAVTSLPLAHLFELGGRTIWAPAIVHTAIDGFKLVSVPGDALQAFSLTVAAGGLVVPLVALAARRPRTSPHDPSDRSSS